MRELRASMEHPHALSEFARKGMGVRSIARILNYSADFAGSYVLIENGMPFYVGISRSVLARLRQHTIGKSHFDASLTFSMAREKTGWAGKRELAMKEPAFLSVFADAQARLQRCQVATVKIENDLEIYLFEAFAAIELDTCKWNTFRTH
jgi:hypothetical protein